MSLDVSRWWYGVVCKWIPNLNGILLSNETESILLYFVYFAWAWALNRYIYKSRETKIGFKMENRIETCNTLWNQQHGVMKCAHTSTNIQFYVENSHNIQYTSNPGKQPEHTDIKWKLASVSFTVIESNSFMFHWMLLFIVNNGLTSKLFKACWLLKAYMTSSSSIVGFDIFLLFNSIVLDLSVFQLLRK